MANFLDPNGTDSVGNPSSNSNVPQFSTTSDLNLNLSPTITAVSSDTTDLLHRTSLSSGVTHNFNPVPRQPFSPPLYRLIPSQNSSSSHNNNNNIPSSFPGTQDSSDFSVPSILSISTNASSFQPSGPRMNYPAPMQLSSSNLMSSRSNDNISPPLIPNQSLPSYLRSRSRSRDEASFSSPPVSPVMKRGRAIQQLHHTDDNVDREKEMLDEKETRRKEICYELAKNARKENDAMVYLDGPRIYTCGECRTHLTSHDEIISKSFHGRHGKIFISRM